jgi:hypothetical protein
MFFFDVIQLETLKPEQTLIQSNAIISKHGVGFSFKCSIFPKQQTLLQNSKQPRADSAAAQSQATQ